jgi:ABC-type multidrug transport system fused ATPase/permease subunit
LKQISIDVPAGAKIAIHGRGGGGKSTLLDLIYGLRECTSGRIELDSVDYRDVRPADVRGSVALVRSPEVFPGTVLENVRLGADADIAEVRGALASAGVLDPVLALPDGMQTQLATGGNPLSPSQAVRIKLARAIVGKPRVLLLDEMLDLIGDLDPNGALIRTLFAKDAPWTLIVTTGDPTLWPLFDRVYRLEGGRLYDDWESAKPMNAGARA